ncbi:MAG: hypothetical protein Q8842_01110, partial [Candidatus Phytoplasma australasiaticum]|nr:hypothetical protein [Candidatus Phytoplasma australasiaticum]
EDFFSPFLDHIFPQELREAKVEEFVNLKQGRMSVKEYALKFHQLSRYAPEMVSSMKAKTHKFASGLSHELVLESKATLLITDIDISWLVVYM